MTAAAGHGAHATRSAARRTAAAAKRGRAPASAGAHRLISASDLKRQRGWTEGLVAALLGAPDAHGPNPHGFRAPMRFFRADRVAEAEREPAFARRVAQLAERQAWRRAQPTRTHAPADVPHLEWLDDPRLLALFHAPRRPRRPRRRPAPPSPAPAPAPGLRYEVLRLF